MCSGPATRAAIPVQPTRLIPADPVDAVGNSIHWISKITMLVVLVSLLWWQAPTHWRSAIQCTVGQCRLITCGTTTSMANGVLRFSFSTRGLACSRGIDRLTSLTVWRRKANKRQVTLRGLFAVQSVAAVMLALGCIEGHLRRTPILARSYRNMRNGTRAPATSGLISAFSLIRYDLGRCSVSRCCSRWLVRSTRRSTFSVPHSFVFEAGWEGKATAAHSRD